MDKEDREMQRREMHSKKHTPNPVYSNDQFSMTSTCFYKLEQYHEM